MAEKHEVEESPRPVSPIISDDEDKQDDPLDLLQSDSSESESESRKKQSEPRTKKKREFNGDRIDKSLSELAKGTAKVYPNKAGGNFVTGFNVHSKEAKQKRTDRAKRFGIESPEKARKSEDLSSVILPPKSTIGGDKVRSEALLVSGVDSMSTQDVFNYFKEYDPSSIEWINDTSCNVVWLDPHSAARALFNMSQPQHILPQRVRPPQPSPPPVREEQEPEPMEQEEEDDDDDFLDLVSDRETGEQERHRRSTSRSPNPNSPPAPSSPSPPTSSLQGRVIDDNSTMEDDMDMGPVHLSREEASRTAVPCSVARGDLVIRYATTADKKALAPGHRSQYYIKYGNPNFGGMKGLISGTMKKKIREGKFVPGQRKRRYGDDDASDDEDRQEYARKRRNHGNGVDSQRHQRMEERDSDGDSVEMDLQLLTKPLEPRLPRRMYCDDLEKQIKTVRKQTTDTTPEIIDARERIKLNRPPATSRLGYHAASEESSGSESDGGGFPSGNIPNLKIMVANERDSWDDDDDNDDDDDEKKEQRGLQDLRSRLKSRRTNPQFLDTLPSLSIQVDCEDF